WYAVVWRLFAACVAVLLVRIEQKIAASRAALQPIELRRMNNIIMAVMAPRRIYDDSVWRGAISDGTAVQLTDKERRQLTNEYWAAGEMTKVQDQFVAGDKRLLAA